MSGYAGERPDQLAEPVAAHLEVAVLVEGGAGRRPQHYRLLQPGCFGVAGGKLGRPLERAGDLVGRPPLELGGKASRRFPDEISLTDAREEARERGDAAGLRLAARDPEDIGEAGERLRRRIRVGGLRIVD